MAYVSTFQDVRTLYTVHEPRQHSPSLIHIFVPTKVRTRSLNVLQPAMASDQETKFEFERVFGKTIDTWLDSGGDLDFDRKCETQEKLNALIRVLELNHKISGWSGRLKLESNRIKSTGAKDLARMLEKNTIIHTLNLFANEIEAAGATDLATVLEKNTTIRTIDVGCNCIGEVGAKDLATMLTRNTTIHTLLIDYNDIGADGVKSFEQMFDKNVTIKKLRLNEKDFTQPMEKALARNKNGREALQQAVQIKHSQAIEVLLKKYHENLNFEKELVVGIWKIVSQNNRIPNPTTLKILVDLAIQSDASDMLHELIPHLDEDAVALLLPHLDDAALDRLRTDHRPEIKNMMDIALLSVNSTSYSSRFAELLTSLLALPTDVFAKDGTPRPSIFLECASRNISKRRITLAAAAVRRLLERQHTHEIKTWVDAHTDSNTLMTGLDVTKSAENHLERYADTPLDLQQTNPSLDLMIVPEWYDHVLVQPAVDAVRNQLEQRRVAALADTTQTDMCQQLANESLEADRQVYGGALSKAKKQNPKATQNMLDCASQKAADIRRTWETNHDTGKPQRPTHLNMSASATVAQVKLQAVQQGGAFRKVVELMRDATGLTVSMVKGSVDRDGLLRKHEGVDNEESGSSLYLTKSSYRIAQKLWVRGNVRSICDINRALFVADTFEDFVKAAQHVFSRSDIHIVDIKDRVNNPTYGGWSDLVLLFSVGRLGHIHELQLALSPMMVARGAMVAHEAYARARYFVEMLQKCDLHYDYESSESKQQKYIEILTQVNEGQKQQIEDLKQQIEALEQQNEDQKRKNEVLKRPGRTLCGWLQQADGERKNWKRCWFVLSNGWLTYHNNSKVKSSMPILKRINIAKGGMPISICTITLDSNSSQLHKFTITNESEGTHLHLDASNSHKPPSETHTRKEWIDAMRSHTGCKLG